VSTAAFDPMAWFPYTPRPYQDKAVRFASRTYSQKTVGLVSADCGVGKTVAVLSGYLAARSRDPFSRLLVLTRTHSQSKVFEEELTELRLHDPGEELRTALTATSMVSRVHVCPMKARMDQLTTVGFMKQCSKLVKTGQCSYYWNCYSKNKGEFQVSPRAAFRDEVESLLSSQVVTREVAERLSESSGYCPYELLRWCAKGSRVLIGPYDYLFRERVRNAFLSSIGCNLDEIDILVDEAHNLPDHVLSSEAAEIRGQDLVWLRKNKSLIVRETGVSWLEETVDFLWETVMLQLDGLKDERRLNTWEVYPRFAEPSQLSRLMEFDKAVQGMEDAVPVDTPLDRLVSFLSAGNRTVQSEDWLVTIEPVDLWDKKPDLEVSNTLLKIRPLNAAGLIAPVLRGARSAIVMSGTLRPTEHYGRILGIPTAEKEDLLSPYPKGTRLILVDKEVSAKYTVRGPSMWRKIAERISVALSTMPANKSALIAFPSYAILQEILSYGVDCGFREILVEDRKIRIEEVEESVLLTPHAIFCVYGGKVSEGIDLVEKGSSVINLIIGVGIPFSPPSSHQKALQEFYDRRYGEGSGYYFSSVLPSIRQVVQLAGRLRRSPGDRGIIILLDRRFLQYMSAFGEDASSDLWPYGDVQELAEAIGLFVEEVGSQ
jgi:DNA excision repair protein ERCC-2